MDITTVEAIFQKRSSTFYPSAKLFPKRMQEDVAGLYGFVRVADDYVDLIPQQSDRFRALRKQWQIAVRDPDFDTASKDQDNLHVRLVKNMVRLSNAYGFEAGWIESFFDTMQMDLDNRRYETLEDTLTYTYGSAEVIGLMMAKIMRLPDEALSYAMLQGRAMQWINFIRDLDEDTRLGRCYFPSEDLKHFGLPDLKISTVTQLPEQFCAFIRYQLTRYDEWQAEAEQGFRFIPSQPRRALKAAIDAYNEVAIAVAKDPMSVNNGGRSA